MKVQFIIPSKQNITNPIAGDYQLIPIDQLQSIPPASCNAIYVGDCCDYFPNREEILQTILSKLRYGGELLIDGIDLLMLCRGVSNGTVQQKDAKNLLFNKKQSCSTIKDTSDLLIRTNLSIVESRLMQCRYSIKAVRPHPNS